MNDPIVAASLRPPMSRRTQPQTPTAEKPTASVPPSAPKSKGMTLSQDLALVPRRQPPSPQGFPLDPRGLCPISHGEYLPAEDSLLVQPLHSGITGDDCFPYSSNGQDSLPPGGSMPG